MEFFHVNKRAIPCCRFAGQNNSAVANKPFALLQKIEKHIQI
jgi:hypothetical protein